MKKLFKAIRNSEVDTVKQIIQENPELVNCIAKQPPKKDDGQSPLQVALKTGNIEIADFLIDMNADLNFIESENCCNAWRTPVIQDAINMAVMCSRWNTNDKIMGFRVFSTMERANQAYTILKKMIENGADVNATDSYGNSGVWRFCLQANQILPRYNYTEHCESDDRVLTKELHEDLNRLLHLLKKAGADVTYAAPNVGKNVLEFYCEGALSVLLKEVFGNN